MQIIKCVPVCKDMVWAECEVAYGEKWPAQKGTAAA